MNSIKILKTRNVKTPHRGTYESAGLDFFIPEFDEAFYNDFYPKNDGAYIEMVNGERMIRIRPTCGALIPAGIKYSLPKGYALVAMNKSGVTTKKGLVVGACVCDSDYQGEVHLHVINTTKEVQSLRQGEKVEQFLILKVELPTVELVESEFELFSAATQRGTGGFGSTGTV
jgi:dUTP pyrophosphatase